jgi:transposase InsO family protein
VEEEISTPHGKLILGEIETPTIDVELSEKVYQANEIQEKKGSKQKQLMKLHRYFGHCSGDSLWRVIKYSSNKSEYTAAEVKEICDNCNICQYSKRKMPRKKTSLPRSTAFNQVVTMDLKCHEDGTYVLWLVDDATRLIRGQVIKDKMPETIIDALEKTWVNGHGIGPGLPEKYFFSDNGGEFVNEKMLEMAQAAGIRIKNTASYSPQQNGLNERNHGLADIIVEKLRRECPKMSLQEAVDQAAWGRNAQINEQRGFSPFQLVFGRNPSLPGVSDATTGGLETMTYGEISTAMFQRMIKTRLLMLNTNYDNKLKVAAKERLPGNVDIQFGIGDEIVFREGKENKLRDGKIVGFDGPIALIRWGNSDRRVPKHQLLPRVEIRQESDSEEKTPESEHESETEDEIIPEIRPTRRGPKRRKKPEIIPEIRPRKIYRQEEEDSTTPYLDQWTDDEADAKKTKNPCLTLPRITGNIDMWNTYGEKFSGTVIKVGKRKFKIREHGTNAELWIELEKLNYWDYCESQEVPKVNRSDGNASLFALRTI